MLSAERELLMQDKRGVSAVRCERMFAWPSDWRQRHDTYWDSYTYTVEKFAREEMRTCCFLLLGESPYESVPRRK
jgi:hypothetical protein